MKRGLYIHIPFCVRKCNYCAFLSFESEPELRRRYAEALVKELRLRGDSMSECTIDTVYFGGGTPSLMETADIESILDEVRKDFVLGNDAEVTIEANPGTLGSSCAEVRRRLAEYRELGINRLSMGVQSMDDSRLRYLGRIHTSSDVIRDAGCAREAGFDNLNLDLIFSVPGETVSDALHDAERITELEPEHISCYSLQLEEGTVFYNMAEAGKLKETDDETDRHTYHEICSFLKSKGYEHYEISSFGRLNGTGEVIFGEERSVRRARHNSLYWDMSDYIGAGLGASGFLDGRRYRNSSDVRKYMLMTDEGILPECSDEVHLNTPFDNISEAVFTGLRRREGISYREAADAWLRAADSFRSVGTLSDTECRRLFWRIFEAAKAEALSFSEQGLLIIGSEGMRLTAAGIDVSNTVMSSFV